MNAAVLESLTRALRNRDLVLWEASAEGLERLVARVAMGRDRDMLRALALKLAEWALACETFAEEGFPIGRFRDRWAALSEHCERVLALDEAGATEENVAFLRKFAHAQAILEHVAERQVTSLAEIRVTLGRWQEPNACWNCVDRLVRRDLLIRMPRGFYRLSPRGADLIQRSAAEAPQAVDAPAAATVPEAAADPQPRRGRKGAPAGQMPASLDWLLVGRQIPVAP